MARPVPPFFHTLPAGPKLNLGCGENIQPAAAGWVNLDRDGSGGADMVFDLEHCAPHLVTSAGGLALDPGQPLPFPADHFVGAWACHSLEHVRELIPLLGELWHVLQPDAPLFVECPQVEHISAYDIEHVRQIRWNSFQCLYHRPNLGSEDWMFKQLRNRGYGGGHWHMTWLEEWAQGGCWKAIYIAAKDPAMASTQLARRAGTLPGTL